MFLTNKTTMKATLLILMTGGVLCAQPPQGQQGPPPVIKVLDADKNGELSATEIANASTALAELDSDGNGRLSEEELHPKPSEDEGEERGHRPPRRERDEDEERPTHPVMEALDQNDDGTISKRELARASKSLLELDEDDNGILEQEEMTPEDSPKNEGEEGGGGRPPHPPRR